MNLALHYLTEYLKLRCFNKQYSFLFDLLLLASDNLIYLVLSHVLQLFDLILPKNLQNFYNISTAVIISNLIYFVFTFLTSSSIYFIFTSIIDVNLDKIVNYTNSQGIYINIVNLLPFLKLNKHVRIFIEQLFTFTCLRLINLIYTISKKLSNKIQCHLLKTLFDIQEEVSNNQVVIQNALTTNTQSTLSQYKHNYKHLNTDKKLELLYEIIYTQNENLQKFSEFTSMFHNVKLRGNYTENKLENILLSTLTPGEIIRFASIKNEREKVDFALKFPSRHGFMYLSIDAKCPLENFKKLLEIKENETDPNEINRLRSMIAHDIAINAKSISEKYINPPLTFDIALMFIPIEQLFNFVSEIPNLFTSMFQKYNVIIVGPHNLISVLHIMKRFHSNYEMESITLEVVRNLSKNPMALKVLIEWFNKIIKYSS